MSTSILGARIRERRRQIGLTQSELARRVEVSPSYINLIERNKRGIAGPLLQRVAGALELTLDELDGASERRLLGELGELALQPELRRLGVEVERAGELIGRFPGWARALGVLARAERDATDAVNELADRLTHDPFLAESVHRMLSAIAVVRSAAEILDDSEPLEPAYQTRFQRMIHDEAQTLTVVGESLAEYFDRVGETNQSLTPRDELESLFDAHANRFAGIESVAETVQHKLSRGPSGLPALDRTGLDSIVRESCSSEIDHLINQAPAIESAAARHRARDALHRYALNAVVAPTSELLDAARKHLYDIERLAEEFGLDTGAIGERLCALPINDETPRFGHFRANAAGTLVSVRNAPGLIAPRYSSACPLWVLYRAQQSPESVIRQRAVFPNGSRFIFLARASLVGAPGFGKPRHYVTDMLTLSEADARLTIYAPESSVPTEDVGPACRICPRERCDYRVGEPLDPRLAAILRASDDDMISGSNPPP
ncbi:MAG: short-chain fatty acyl-CoA regulator family protein [Pseudomonadota bacterium]